MEDPTPRGFWIHMMLFIAIVGLIIAIVGIVGREVR